MLLQTNKKRFETNFFKKYLTKAYGQGNVRSGKCLRGEMSGWGSLHRGSVRSGNLLSGEMSIEEASVREVSVGDLSSGKCQSGNCPHTNESAKNIGNHYELPFPFRNDPKMPNNRYQAPQRLKQLKNKLDRNPTFFDHYKEFMDALFEKGHTQKSSTYTSC